MRLTIDDDVARLLARSNGSVTAFDVARRLGITAVAATHCLQRLVRAGTAQVIAETTPTERRATEIVLHYQVNPKRTLGWPAWLDPRPVPRAVASVRRYMQPMTWGEDECETA